MRQFLTRFLHRFFRRVVLSLVVFLLGGCVLISKEYRYGYVAFEGDDLYGTGTTVHIPENAPSITQRYQPDPVGRSGDSASGHEGIDIIGKRRTPVIAPAAGVVISSYREPMYGNRLVIKHGVDKDNKTLITRYYHLKSRKVRKGDIVTRGQLIGTMGATGLLAPAPHLHFETRRIEPRGPFQTSVPMNPHLFWWDGIGRVTCFDKTRHYSNDGFRLTYPVPCRTAAE